MLKSLLIFLLMMSVFMCVHYSRMKSWKMKKMKLRRLIVSCNINAVEPDVVYNF